MTIERGSRRPLLLQLLVTAMIVLSLAGAAHLASSDDDARAFDEAAERTRLEFEGAVPGSDGGAR